MVYRSIPFEFHTLQESLKGFASEIIENIKTWKPQEPVNLPYEDWYSERICNLIKNIFPNFEGLEIPLKRLIRSQDNNQIDLVISIIKSYTGQQFLFKTVSELLKEISIDDTVRLRAIEFALHNRGVMSGYYGGSEALKLKKQYAQPWLRSRNERVKAFAKQYIAKLDRQIAAERHREEQRYEMHRRG